MDIQKAAAQLINYLGKNPELITQFIEHPYSTTATAIGTKDQLSKQDVSQVVTAAAALSNNQRLGTSDIANIASLLLGQNGGSVHALTSMLFGGGNTAQATAAAQAQTTSAGTLDLGSLVSMAALAATLMSSAAKRKKEQEAAQAAAAQAAAQQAAAQQAAAQAAMAAQAAAAQQATTAKPNGGLDIGEIATLASQFLGASGAAQAAPVQPAPVQQTVPAQQAAPGLDFGTLAQLASVLLSQR